MSETLEDHIKRLIEAEGPIDVATYMRLCLTHPTLGYYTKGKPIGRPGDFITAPEISQLFGELIGVWVLDTWQKLGSPAPFKLIEVGPGRATLMADVLRTCQSLNQDFIQNISVHLVEVSPTLKEQQEETLASFQLVKSWHNSLETIGAASFMLIGNEFLDALPILQYQFDGERWAERVVGLSKERHLTWGLRPSSLKPSIDMEPKQGDILEITPEIQGFIKGLCERVVQYPSAALFIDYGHLKSGYGDTFQAVKNHEYVDAFEEPGFADITAHVNFAPLVDVTRKADLSAHTTTQGEFLLNMGLLERAGQLGANLDEEAREKIRNDVERLAAPEKMGNLFKIMALTPRDVIPHGFQP